MNDLEKQLSRRLDQTEQILIDLLSFVEEVSEICICGTVVSEYQHEHHHPECPFVQSKEYISSIYGTRRPGKRRDAEGISIYRKGGR